MHPCNREDRKGGGVALIISSSFKVNQLRTTNFNSFEHAFRMLLGDLNLHIDDPEDSDADQLITTMEAFGIKQHIKFPTHQLGHTLDLIAAESTIQLTCAQILGPYLSDHRLIIIKTNSKKCTKKSQYMEYRKLDKAATTKFQ